MDNLEELDKFPEIFNLPRLDQKEIENLKRPITRNEIALVAKKLQTNESSGPGGFTIEFYKIFKEE